MSGKIRLHCISILGIYIGIPCAEDGFCMIALCSDRIASNLALIVGKTVEMKYEENNRRVQVHSKVLYVAQIVFYFICINSKIFSRCHVCVHSAKHPW